MIGQGMHGFVSNHPLPLKDLDKALREPTDTRIFAISEAMQQGYSVEKIHSLTKIDRWFLLKLLNIIHLSEEIKNYNLETLPADLLRSAKVYGFSDFQIARLTAKDGVKPDLLAVRDKRESLGIVPFVKQIDTLAGEFPAETNYLYMTYSVKGYDIDVSKDSNSVVVLGSGAYRIGSSVEFDWCSVNAIQTARKLGYKSIMINYNPETVSTDYDMCDRLYFD